MTVKPESQEQQTEETSGHTPGPWRVEKCGCGHPACKSYFVRGPLFQDKGLTYEADARLMSAAPDMLETLKYYRDECSGYEPYLSVFHRKLDTAIAKAEGLSAKEPSRD